MTIDINTPAPTFSLPSDQGIVNLSDLKGKWVVLYFYPKDNTPGCTQESCDFRDLHPDFMAVDAVIFGISKDSVVSHGKFKEKFQLPFPLLSDATGQTCEDYGVWVEKSMYGKKYFGIERSTFLIGPDGSIKKIWRKVKVGGHAREVFEAIQAEGK